MYCGAFAVCQQKTQPIGGNPAKNRSLHRSKQKTIAFLLKSITVQSLRLKANFVCALADGN